MNLLFGSKDWWKIVNGEEKKLESPIKLNSLDSSILVFFSKETGITSDKEDEDNPKFVKSLANWYKKNAKASALFVCNINLRIISRPVQPTKGFKSVCLWSIKFELVGLLDWARFSKPNILNIRNSLKKK